MQITIIDPSFQTQIFTVILAVVILLSIKKDSHPHLMGISNTNELKGLAILMVIFSHIGYFLDSADKFLYPLSVAGGIGVNIFLFLSGFGLTFSELKSPNSILGFYLKRLKKIFIPMWTVLIITLSLDYFLLEKSYSAQISIKSFFGFFPNADIYSSINSPLWYFTFILCYYLVFPLLFLRKQSILTAFMILLLSFLILNFDLLTNIIDKDVLKLYKLHYLAFPLGIAFAVLQNSKNNLTSIIQEVNSKLRYFLIILLVLSISYTAINSGVGEEIKYEQFISLITMTFFILIILFKKFKFQFLVLLGVYSYEIYLIQWPLLYRYDFLYKFLPAYLATSFYLGLFLIIGYLINKFGTNVLNKFAIDRLNRLVVYIRNAPVLKKS